MEAQKRTSTVRVICERLSDGFADVLMVHNTERGEKWAGWGLPGGGVQPDKDEDLATAATRELFEETGLRVLPGDLVEIDCSPARGSDTHFNHTFRCSVYDPAMGEITIENDEEKTVDKVEWIPYEDIMEARSSRDSTDSQGRQYYPSHLTVVCG